MATTTNPLLQGASGKFGPFVVYKDGEQTVLRAQAAEPSRTSPFQSRRRADVYEIARRWRLLSPQTQAGWGRLSPLLPRWDGNAPKGQTPAYLCFLATQTARAAQNLPFTEEAPRVPALPGFLPVVELTAHLGLPADGGDAVRVPADPAMGMETTAGGGLRRRVRGAGDFVLRVGGAEFGEAVQVWASKPLPFEGQPTAKTRYVCLLTVPLLTGAGVDAGAVYADRFGAPRAGQRVAARLVPLSAAGFRGMPVVLSCDVDAGPPADLHLLG